MTASTVNKNNTYKQFYIDDFVKEFEEQNTKYSIRINIKGYGLFYGLCDEVDEFLTKSWESDNSSEIGVRIKNALLGHTKEVSYFVSEIELYLKNNNYFSIDFPPWYDNLYLAIFHEVWGLSGLYDWFYRLNNSTDCLIAGNNIFYEDKGKMILQKQKMSNKHFDFLRKNFLMSDDKQKLSSYYNEVYFVTGERISIVTKPLGKTNYIAIRKFVVDTMTFDKQAKLKTIPKEFITPLKAMVKLGFNVLFAGAMGSGKTTFLTTYESYEDKTLQGGSIERDPEIPFHKFKSESPFIQLVGDENIKDLPLIYKRLNLSYLITGEARNGNDWKLTIDVSNIGTKRMKTTAHFTHVDSIIEDIASSIYELTGGYLKFLITKVAKAFDYIFYFIKLPDGRRVLEGLYEVRLEDSILSLHQIMKYEYGESTWSYKADFGENIYNIGQKHDKAALNVFVNSIKALESNNSIEGNVVNPVYGDLKIY